MAEERKLNQEEINAVAWRVCDTFRGVVDPSEYKNYILVFLFLKYLSDVWEDNKEQYDNQYKGDEERIKRKLSRERFILPDGCSYYDVYRQRNESNIGEIINIALDKIEEANKMKLVKTRKRLILPLCRKRLMRLRRNWSMLRKRWPVI